MKINPLASVIAQAFATVGIAGIALVGCSKPSDKPAEPKVETTATTTTTSTSSSAVTAGAKDPNKAEIVIGTTVGDFGDMVKNSVKPQLEKQGYQVKLVEFSDYVISTSMCFNTSHIWTTLKKPITLTS